MGLFDWLFGSGTKLGEFLTAGPDEDDHPLTSPVARMQAANTGNFSGGVYAGARFVRAHPDRVGSAIVPQTIVVHTTDMLPDDFDALVSKWSKTAGSYSAAHFNLGRTPAQGLVQMVPITRNANHAGGPMKNGRAMHGWWITPSGGFVHPNTVAVGIEVHAAGQLHWADASHTIADYVDDHKVKAEFKVANGEVHVDGLGRPWHAVTSYQLEQLGKLLGDLRTNLKSSNLIPRADAAFIKDRSRWDTSYAVPVASTLVGHVSLDPINKTDPGPQLMDFINDLARKESWT